MVLLCGAALAPSVAAAQGMAADPEYLPDNTADRDDQARNAFQQGRKSYEEGDYRAAWGHFHQSYELSHRPELLYNIGQTADRLGRDEDALTAFRQYLEQLPNAENRREVENRLRALEERTQKDGNASPLSEQSADAVPPLAAEPPTPPTSDQPTRTEWYFRGALGLGARSISIADKAAFEASASGVGLAGELSVGYTMMPGVVLGGGVFFDWTSSPTLEVKGLPSAELDSANLTMLGPLIDWYIDPQVDGFHAQGSIAVAALTYSPKGAVTGTNTATGAALLLGGGYEWTLAENMAIGALGRLTFASVSDDPYTHTVVALSALCTLTWY